MEEKMDLAKLTLAITDRKRSFVFDVPRCWAQLINVQQLWQSWSGSRFLKSHCESSTVKSERLTRRRLSVPQDGFLLGCVFAVADYPEQMADKHLLATWKRVSPPPFYHKCWRRSRKMQSFLVHLASYLDCGSTVVQKRSAAILQKTKQQEPLSGFHLLALPSHDSLFLCVYFHFIMWYFHVFYIFSC